MWGMALVNAVRDFPAEPSIWFAGLSAVAAAATLYAMRERARRRGLEAALDRARAEHASLNACRTELVAQRHLWVQRCEGLAGAHDDIILRRDASGRLTHINDAFAAAFGVVRSSLLGTAWHPPADSSVSSLPRGTATGNGLSRIRYLQRLNTVHGWRWFAWEDHAIRAADGTLLEIQSTGRDITERREAHEQQRAARAAAETLRRRRQSLRQALANDLLPAMAALTAASFHQAPGLPALLPRLAALQDCLTFEGEKVNVILKPFEPRRVVAGAVSALAEQAGCGIASIIAADVPRLVLGDAALLRQIIERLAGSAMGDGNGICIRISSEGARLRLAFETPWPRVPGEGARPGDLALAAVRPVIEAMKGELAIEHGHGAASVRVEIPAPAAGETAGLDAVRGAAGVVRPSPGTFAGTA